MSLFGISRYALVDNLIRVTNTLIHTPITSFHLLLKAIPLYNSKKDFHGLSQFTFSPNNNNLYTKLGKPIDFNPFAMPSASH